MYEEKKYEREAKRNWSVHDGISNYDEFSI